MFLHTGQRKVLLPPNKGARQAWLEAIFNPGPDVRYDSCIELQPNINDAQNKYGRPTAETRRARRYELSFFRKSIFRRFVFMSVYSSAVVSKDDAQDAACQGEFQYKQQMFVLKPASNFLRSNLVLFNQKTRRIIL